MSQSMANELLSLMLGLSTPLYAEEPMRQAERFGTISAATEKAVEVEGAEWPWSPEELGTAALAVTAAESGKWHPKVHGGQLKGDKGRSACLGGVMRGTGWVTDDEWKRSVGITYEPTVVCMRLTVRILARHAQRCFGRNPGQLNTHKMAVAFYAYGSGRGCVKRPPKWALDRAWMWRALEKRRRSDD